MENMKRNKTKSLKLAKALNVNEAWLGFDISKNRKIENKRAWFHIQQTHASRQENILTMQMSN